MKIVFDLDGTLADCTHRLHWIDRKEKNWGKFFSACNMDKPIQATIRLLFELERQGNIIEIWSGRSAVVLEATQTWLGNNLINQNLLKHMRPEHERCDDHLLKKRWLDDARATGGDVEIAFEDRARVVQMWRENSVTCYQVADGDF